MGLSTDWSKKELDECYRCWLGGLDSQAQALSVWTLKLEDPRIMVHHACRCKLQSYYRAPLTTTCSYQSAEGTTSHADLYHLITPKCMCFPRRQAMRATQYACPCKLHGKAFAPLLALVLSALPFRRWPVMEKSGWPLMRLVEHPVLQGRKDTGQVRYVLHLMSDCCSTIVL